MHAGKQNNAALAQVSHSVSLPHSIRLLSHPPQIHKPFIHTYHGCELRLGNAFIMRGRAAEAPTLPSPARLKKEDLRPKVEVANAEQGRPLVHVAATALEARAMRGIIKRVAASTDRRAGRRNIVSLVVVWFVYCCCARGGAVQCGEGRERRLSKDTKAYFA